MLLILAGISIATLTGENGLLSKATEAKEETRAGAVQDERDLWKINQEADNYSETGTAESLNALLERLGPNGQKLLTEEEVEQVEKKGQVTIGKRTIVFGTTSIETIGSEYDDSWIGKQITYTADNGESNWIILGHDEATGDVLITTKNPVGNKSIDYTLAQWGSYETDLNSACLAYAGKIGKNNVAVKEARSIKLEDINYAVGFSETVNSVTISNSNGGYAYPNSNYSGWIKNTDSGGYSSWTTPVGVTESYYYYNDNGTYRYGSVTNGYSNKAISLGRSENMKYILADGTEYWVGSRSVDVSDYGADFFVASVNDGSVGSSGYSLCLTVADGGGDFEGSYSMALRPIVVLSSDIPLDDVEIGDYVTYVTVTV